jgi:hypothetical protein
MSIVRRLSLLVAVPALLVAAAPESHAFVIDFENFTGPSLFSLAGNAQTLSIPTPIGNVTVSGGVVLTAATNLPADETSIYGTAGNAANLGVTVGTGFTNPLTVTFPVPINNFFLDVLNGNIIPVTYEVADNASNSNTSTLVPNLNGGNELISFAATGTVVTVDALTGQPVGNGIAWDFFIDNIHFDEPLPGTVPEPSSVLLFAFGALGLAAIRSRHGRSSTTD